jgi:hypothetical protein
MIMEQEEKEDLHIDQPPYMSRRNNVTRKIAVQTVSAMVDPDSSIVRGFELFNPSNNEIINM